MKRCACVFLLLTASAGADVPRPVVAQLSPGVAAVFEVRSPGREPDGNSVIFEAPTGLIVVDTGRHTWHREAVLRVAKDTHRPIVAVINSHWHLDHDSGNPEIREAYPRLRIYASGAIDGALQGFLADSLKKAPEYLADGTLPAEIREDIAADRLTILNGAALRPDVVVSATRSLIIGGKTLQVHLAKRAATAGDVWVVDKKSGVAALGDLVTLPAPYFETACPEGWSQALSSVSETSFKTAIPGHGPKMSVSDVRRYRAAFDDFLICAVSAEAPERCAAGWVEGVQPMLLNGGYAPSDAMQAAIYYVGLLRTSNFQKRYCELG